MLSLKQEKYHDTFQVPTESLKREVMKESPTKCNEATLTKAKFQEILTD
jgi:hypothetical protein